MRRVPCSTRSSESEQWMAINISSLPNKLRHKGTCHIKQTGRRCGVATSHDVMSGLTLQPCLPCAAGSKEVKMKRADCELCWNSSHICLSIAVTAIPCQSHSTARPCNAYMLFLLFWWPRGQSDKTTESCESRVNQLFVVCCVWRKELAMRFIGTQKVNALKTARHLFWRPLYT